ncbi:MAG: DMT family transporter, partial [Mailhella sp.]|nr:DMT family transporter [Mailhella sp.]
VFWLSFSGETSQAVPNPFLGNMLELGAVFCGVGYTLACRNLSAAMSPWVYTAAMSFGGVLFYIPLTFLPLEFSPVILDVSIPDWLPLFSIFYLGVVVSLLGYGFYNYGVSKLSATEAAAYINLIPVITLGIGVLFLEERLTTAQYFASLAILGGMLLSQYKAKKELS